MSFSHLPLKKKIALKLHNKYRNNQSKIHRLNYILWECTLRCNLNCIHCGSDCKKDSTVKDMPVADFMKALDELKPIITPNETMIVLTGGEALLRKDLELVGKQLYQRGFPWGIVTNGLQLTPSRIKSLQDAGMRAVTVSLDGLEESHNWMRANKNSYRNAADAIAALSETIDLRYDVVTCVNQRNFSELTSLKELLISLGVKEWRLFTIFPIGRAKEHKELQLPPEKFKLLFDFIKVIREEGKIKLNYGCEGFLGNYEGEVRDNFFFCRAGINVASVLADGSISACPNLRENFIQGNIYNDDFADVWENRYEIFRNRSWTKQGACGSCNNYNYCLGNGMHLREQTTGDLLFCHHKRIEEGEKLLAQNAGK